MPTSLSAEDLNEINRAFWQERQSRFEWQLGEKLVRAIAMERLYDQQFRGVQVAQQSTLEYELDIAEQLQNQAVSERAEPFRKQALREHAARGGRANKLDALSRHIEGIVSGSPKMTVNQLLLRLGQEASASSDLIEEVDENQGVIWFVPGRGRKTKSAKISGLKHRLSRARKKV